MGGISVNYSVLNQRGTPAMFSDSLANRPAAGFAGRLFIDTDIPTTGIYRDTGSTWELIAGGVPATPNLQQVTDAGNTTTNNVIVQARGIYGGASVQSFHRLIVRDVATFTTQREALSIDRQLTYDGTATFLSGPAYGSVAGSDLMTLAASITIPNGVSNATGVYSGVTIRPAGFNITQTQGAGLRALSNYRTQLTIEQSSTSSSTISHYAHFFATAIFKTNNSNPVTITNNYGLAISDQTEVSTGLTLTNRFGVAQFGANDRNFFLGRVGIGTSVDAGFQLDVNGTVRTTDNATINDITIGQIGGNRRISWSLNDLSFLIGGSLIANFSSSQITSSVAFSVLAINLSSGTEVTGLSRKIIINPVMNTVGTTVLFAQNDSAYGGQTTTPGNIFIYNGINTTNSIYGNVVLQHDGTNKRGNVLIGTSTNVPSAILTIASTTQGFLPPVMSETQINSIPSPAEGLLLYNNVDKTLEVRDGTLWQNIPNGLKASATLDFPATAAQNSSDLTITVTNAALNDMVMLGVPNGSVIANTCYTAFVSAANTVTVRFNNFSTASQNPASGTFRVYVIKN